MADIHETKEEGDRVELARSLFAQATMLLEDTHIVAADGQGAMNTLATFREAAQSLQQGVAELASIAAAITVLVGQGD